MRDFKMAWGRCRHVGCELCDGSLETREYRGKMRRMGFKILRDGNESDSVCTEVTAGNERVQCATQWGIRGHYIDGEAITMVNLQAVESTFFESPKVAIEVKGGKPDVFYLSEEYGFSNWDE
jgi:hypothetical protein